LQTELDWDGLIDADPPVGAPAPAPTDNDQGGDTNVRSNFPETWIWTEAMTGYVVVRCYDSWFL